MNVKILTIFILSTILISCENETEPIADNDSGLIEISQAQFESEKMTIGKPTLQPFSNTVDFTGIIIPSVNGQAQVSLPLPGIIDNIRCKPAQMVRRGEVLFNVSGHWFIDLQKDYSQSSAIVSKLKSDYQRAKELYDENIGTQKDFTAAQSNYFAENAKYKALKTKLTGMGLDVSTIEKGEFYSSFPIKSPINGYVSSITASVGQYVEPQQTIATLIDNNSFQLRLSIFERDIHKIQIGQAVAFYLNGNTAQNYRAQINAIGKTIMPDTKSIECYAAIDSPKNISLVSNQFVEGQVITTLDSVFAVPEAAILESENEQYVLLFEKEHEGTRYFKKEKVHIGRKTNNYVELTKQLPAKRLLTNGTYNIVVKHGEGTVFALF
ncbi:MAG: efflux RND transporter periplasmic adaptor subunit [Salinivirgaceae bacterium]